MASFLARRLVLMVIVLLAVSVIVFTLSRISGDPRYLYLGEYTTQEQWDQWGREMGLDRPLIIQYAVWLGDVAKGDLGASLREHRPVLDIVRERIPASLKLGLAAWLFAGLVGWPLGVLSAVKRGSAADYFGRTFALFGQALPPFWVGIMLILIFSVTLEWLPTGRMGGIKHFLMPTLTLGWLAAAGQLRLVRSAMLEALDSEYVKFARAKGVSSSMVIWKHTLRNAAIPPLTYAGLVLAGFIGGTVVTETVFAWPGLGRLAIEAVNQNDFPVLSGVILFITVLYVSVNLTVDVVYAIVDPRIRIS